MRSQEFIFKTSWLPALFSWVPYNCFIRPIRLFAVFGIICFSAYLYVEPVTQPPDGLQELRLARVGFDCLAEPADVHIQCAGIFGVLRAPHLSEKLLAFQDFVRVLHENP